MKLKFKFQPRTRNIILEPTWVTAQAAEGEALGWALDASYDPGLTPTYAEIREGKFGLDRKEVVMGAIFRGMQWLTPFKRRVL